MRGDAQAEILARRSELSLTLRLGGAETFIHTIQSQYNERYGEELSHVEEHAILESFLILLCVFDEDAAGEYQEQA